MGYAMRGNNDNENDNKANAARMAELRAERAGLMGYANHGDFVPRNILVGESDHEILGRQQLIELLDVGDNHFKKMT